MGVLCLLSKFLGTKLNIFRQGKIAPKEHKRNRTEEGSDHCFSLSNFCFLRVHFFFRLICVSSVKVD